MARPLHPLHFPSDPHSRLLDAIEHARLDLARVALEQGAGPTVALVSNGDTALHWLVQRVKLFRPDDVQAMVRLLVQYGASPDQLSLGTHAQHSPLNAALYQRDRSPVLITALLEAGADANQAMGPASTFERPLHAILGTSDQEAKMGIVRALLDHGANPELLNHERLTVLQALARDPVRGRGVAVAMMLIEHGADLHAPSDPASSERPGESAMAMLERRERRILNGELAQDLAGGEVVLAPIVRAWLEGRALRATLQDSGGPEEPAPVAARARL